MFRSGFLFLLGFRCLFLCEGAVFPPSSGTNVTFIPGSTEKIVWSLSDDIKSFSYRSWFFTSSDGGPQLELTRIVDDQDAQILTTSYEVAVEKPATLVLKNVNLTYNGTYRFLLVPDGSSSEVVVFIAVKPTAMAFPRPLIANEGDDVSCTCQGQGGNPPADVTWYKDNQKIGETEKEEKNLTLTNVTTEKDHGNYKCVARSHHNEMFQDEIVVKVTVRPKYKPMKTKIEVPVQAYVGEKLLINCYSEGLPAPTFTITHNVTTNIISNQSRFVKDKVDYSDAGVYECIAKNSLGHDTDSGNLVVKEKRLSTKSTPKKPATQSTTSQTAVRTTDSDGGGSSSGGLSSGALAGICTSVGLLLVVVFIVVYCCYEKKKKNLKNRGNFDPIGGNDCELDNEEPVVGARPVTSANPVRGANPVEGNNPVEEDNAYDTVWPVASAGKTKAPKNDGKTLYASLDTDAMKPKRESKKEPADSAAQTEYASIDFAKTAKAPKVKSQNADPQ